MNPLLFVAGAAGVSGIILATEKVQSRQLANEWAVGVPNFFCKMGKGPESDLFRLGGEYFYPVGVITLLFMFFTMKIIRNVPLKVIATTAIIYTFTVIIIGFMRLSHVAEIQHICATLANRTQSTLKTDADELISPFLNLLQHVPFKPFTDDHLTRTYAVIFPHLAEYCLTVEPFLPYAYLVFGILLEFRPIKNKFWQYLSIIGAIVSFGIMAIAQTSEFANVHPYDLLFNTILQYVIFYIATFMLLSILVIMFRLGMRRVSVLGIFLTISRMQLLGMPELDFHANMLLLIFLIAFIVVTCDFSPGAFVLYALAAYHFQWNIVEWGLVVMLVDNFVYQTVITLMQHNERNQQQNTKTKKE